jgi:hypothetical protein
MTTATDNAITSQIQTAISRSISHNEITILTIDGDSGDALAAIDALTDSDTTETDYTMADYEGVDTMDVWAFTPDGAENEMVWRLAIRFAEPTEVLGEFGRQGGRDVVKVVTVSGHAAEIRKLWDELDTADATEEDEIFGRLEQLGAVVRD